MAGSFLHGNRQANPLKQERISSQLYLKDTVMKATEQPVDVREIRRKLGLNQSQFWSKIGVTQSGGSRYESGRNIPRPVQALLRLVHIEQIDITKVKKEDFDVAEYLKASNPELYKNLKKEARTSKRKKA
ncbi:MAG: type II toxin-antitoxin system MqsA family antitoxin [Azoarcus sp.]|nr:type II toxin-antitoxin system MqsA family antitoxin [Azoarcus sp.]